MDRGRGTSAFADAGQETPTTCARLVYCAGERDAGDELARLVQCCGERVAQGAAEANKG